MNNITILIVAFVLLGFTPITQDPVGNVLYVSGLILLSIACALNVIICFADLLKEFKRS